MFDYCLRVFSGFCNDQFKLCRRLYDSKAVDDDASSINSSSGSAHSRKINVKPVKSGPRVAHTEQFLCKGGVDTGRLLDLSRKALYSRAKAMGGNVLLDEQ